MREASCSKRTGEFLGQHGLLDIARQIADYPFRIGAQGGGEEAVVEYRGQDDTTCEALSLPTLSQLLFVNKLLSLSNRSPLTL